MVPPKLFPLWTSFFRKKYVVCYPEEGVIIIIIIIIIIINIIIIIITIIIIIYLFIYLFIYLYFFAFYRRVEARQA